MVNLLEWFFSSPTVLAATTIVFFTIKGLAWMVVPALVMRRRTTQRRLAARRQAA